MSGPENISKVQRLRSRDGGKCWLCDGPMDFKAEGNSARSATIEHLIPQCRNGPDTMDNLALCHPACNQDLGNRPLAEKIAMRDKRREDAWKAAMRKQIAKVLIP